MYVRSLAGGALALFTGLLLALAPVGVALAVQAEDEEKSSSAADTHEQQPAGGSGTDGDGSADPGHDAKAGQTGDTGHGDTGHGDTGHGGHDRTDLSHQNAGPNQGSPAEFKSDLAIWTLVVFLLLLALLAKFAWGPIMEGLEKREHAVAEMIEQARRDAEAAAERLKGYEAKLAAAVDESREILSQARREAEEAGARIVEDAKTEAQRQVARARTDIESAKNQAIQELAAASVDTAISLAGRMIRKEIRPDDQSRLVREAIEQFPGGNGNN